MSPQPAVRNVIERQRISLDGVASMAVYSICEKYRYWLEWVWNNHEAPRLLGWLMMNPSKATEQKLDPTVTQCRERAASDGYDGIVVVNVHALRSTDPNGLLVVEDPTGPLNDYYIMQAAARCEKIVCAWGAVYADINGRSGRVEKYLRETGMDLYCLELTQGGSPRHPLRIPYTTKPRPWLAENQTHASSI